MKTRNNFVSNSSSCSFIIEDLTSLNNLLKTTFGNDISISWAIDDKISVSLYGRKQVLESIVELLEIDKSYISHSFGSSDKDEYALENIYLSLLFKISDDLLQKCKFALISCEDSDPNSVLVVKMLYMFFKNNRIEIKDNSDSDLNLDKNDFVVKLMYETFKEMNG